MGFDIQPGMVLPVDRLDVTLEAGPHPLETGKEDEIDANSARETAAQAALFDGTVVRLSELSWRDGRLAGRCHAVRYATFLYWLRHRGIAGAGHAFAHAMLVAGFVRHSLRTTTRVSTEDQPIWGKNVYPIGISLLLLVTILLGLFGWEGTLQMGSWFVAILTTALIVGLLWLIVYDAAFVIGYVHWKPAIELLLLLPVSWFSVLLMRWWAKIMLLSQRPEYQRAR